MLDVLQYINGRLVPSVNEGWIDNVEPATGAVYGRIARGGPADVALAVESAHEAFPAWSALTARERSRYMLAISEGIAARLDALAEAESRDNGKPLWLAKSVDIPRAVDNMAFFATEILHTETAAHQTSSSVLNVTLRQPVGVAGCISPWNLPLYLFTWKIAPALAAGCTVVAKPSELTPVTAFMLAQICIEVGLPPGVLNIVHGLGAEVGAAIVEHPHVKAISFTGGTATGKAIASVAAPAFKKLSLELGGKNPTIVFGDVDIPSVAKNVARAAFTNQGEICLCGSRILVHRSVYQAFLDALVAETQRFIVGDPTDPSTRIGALVSQSHMEKVLSYINLARSLGGTVHTGGGRHTVSGRCERGFFVAPTIIDGLDNACRVNQEEIFGPVATVMPFDTDDEAIALANDTQYGLAANIWTNNLGQAHRVAAQLHMGIVWINCWLVRDLRTPFGGMKASGVGREGGTEALRFFTEAKNVCIQY